MANRCKGFTIVELIAVLFIFSTLAISALLLAKQRIQLADVNTLQLGIDEAFSVANGFFETHCRDNLNPLVSVSDLESNHGLRRGLLSHSFGSDLTIEVLWGVVPKIAVSTQLNNIGDASLISPTEPSDIVGNRVTWSRLPTSMTDPQMYEHISNLRFFHRGACFQ